MTPKTTESVPYDRQTVVIATDRISLQADLTVPQGASRIVLFSHGNGFIKPDNVYLAHVLNKFGFATLLLDLLTPEEAAFDEVTANLSADFVALGDRLVGATIWIKEQRELRSLGLGILADDVGANAAFIAAARLPSLIQAIVCRSGEFEHAEAVISYVKAPTLFIVGESDPTRARNEQVAASLKTDYKVQLVNGTTSLIENPSPQLNSVADAVAKWFNQYLKQEETSTLAGAEQARPLLNHDLNHRRQEQK
jgi:putative phosphoribosyl transferase